MPYESFSLGGSFYGFIYLLAVLGLCCSSGHFFSCDGSPLVAEHSLLIVKASFIAEQRLWGTRAQWSRHVGSAAVVPRL